MARIWSWSLTITGGAHWVVYGISFFNEMGFYINRQCVTEHADDIKFNDEDEKNILNNV